MSQNYNPPYGAPSGGQYGQSNQYPPPQVPQGGQYGQSNQYPPPQVPPQNQYPPNQPGGQYFPSAPGATPTAPLESPSQVRPQNQYPPQTSTQPQYPQGGVYPTYPQQTPGNQYRPQGQYPPQGPFQYPPQQGGAPSQYPPSQYPQQGGAPSQYSPQGSQYPPQQGGAPSQYPPQQGNWGSNYYNQINPQEMQLMQAWFNSVDTDRSGNITAQELAALQIAGRQLGLPASKKLIKVFDKNYSGTIDFYEYASLHQFLNKMQASFFAADRDRSGALDANEIYGALQSAGFQVSPQTLDAIINKFDPPLPGLPSTGGRQISFEKFVQIVAHLAAVRSIFEWNDPQRTGKVSLSYDQLAHITVHLQD